MRLFRASRVRVLGVGGELKSTVCSTRGRRAVLMGPVGDLKVPSVYRHFTRIVSSIMKNDNYRPDVIAHDLHPQYLSTILAKSIGLPCVGVQHHHAHAVSVMAEWGIDRRVVAICCDGVGYGTDGAAWGGEVLSCDTASFERRAHLEYFPLVGGNLAAVETWRPAAALACQAFGNNWRVDCAPIFARIPQLTLELFEQMRTRALNAPVTSSMGRLFDAVAFLLGICDRNTGLADAASALEAIAVDGRAEPYPYETRFERGAMIMSPAPMIRGIVRDIAAGHSAAEISARFHETVARMLSATALMSCDACGLTTVVLAGGCFANRKLRSRLTQRLEDRHLRVCASRQLLWGDETLALGQCIAGAAVSDRVQQCA
ncbi:MAG: carbamoyltransferase HypF [Phycisphaerae bacterium]|nr:carbamoyltransferase HypF [Phycisphaerae bacterium]